MLSDIEIAQNAEMYPIGKIAAELSISEEDIEYYGHYKAKLSEQLFQKLDSKPNGKLILVTAINPTPAGEGRSARKQFWHCGNRLWDRCTASRAEQPAAAMHR